MNRVGFQVKVKGSRFVIGLNQKGLSFTARLMSEAVGVQ